MKTLISLSVLMLLGAYSCTTSLDIEKEKEAIKAVIEEEKDAYFARDAVRMGETWIQDPGSRKIWFSVNGLTYLPGWSEVDADHQKGAESEMWDKLKDMEVEFSDYEFNFYENTALVFCTTTWKGQYDGEELHAAQKRILHFVRHNREWKFDLTTILRIPEGNASENKKTAAIYHELKAENIDGILAEDFIGRSEKSRHTWNRENHRNYLNNGVYKRDSIFHQVAGGNWVATRFFREMDWQGKRVVFEAMHFKRFEEGKIAEIWEYGDSQQVE